jgi:hypothetical protein
LLIVDCSAFRLLEEHKKKRKYAAPKAPVSAWAKETRKEVAITNPFESEACANIAAFKRANRVATVERAGFTGEKPNTEFRFTPAAHQGKARGEIQKEAPTSEQVAQKGKGQRANLSAGTGSGSHTKF